MTTKTRVNEIDLLRFIAAIMVVLFHYAFRGHAAGGMSAMPYPLLAPLAQYGHLGVELFFMISGFVILMTAGSGNLQSFVVSRVVRLYPAFWVCCTLTFAAILLIGSPRYSATLSQYLVNLTMLSEFVNVPSIDGAYWSLFVEIKFYAWICVLLALGQIHRIEAVLVAWLLIAVGLEAVPIDRLRSIFITDYAAFFASGSTFFLIWSKGVSARRLGIVVASWALAMYQSLVSLPKLEKFFQTPYDAWVVGAVVTSFFAVMMLVSLGKTGYFGRRRWLLAGVLTYPLYLLHQNIGYMVFNKLYPAVDPHVLMVGTLAGMLLAAWLVHVLFEKPLSGPLKAALNNAFAAGRQLALRWGVGAKLRR